MTLKETLLQELETADDELITAAIDWVRSHKHQPAPPPDSSSDIIRGSGNFDGLLEPTATWAGDDLEECLEFVYATRSKAKFVYDNNPFK
jgi:hypothetical protein